VIERLTPLPGARIAALARAIPVPLLSESRFSRGISDTSQDSQMRQDADIKVLLIAEDFKHVQ
jgi:hypothetical protein